MPTDKWTHPIKLIEAKQAKAKSSLKNHPEQTAETPEEETADDKEVREMTSSMIKDFPVSAESAIKTLNKDKELKINCQANFLKEFREHQAKKDQRKAMLRP